MNSALDIAFFAALAAVFLTLLAGIYSLFRGGDFARSYSNKLMRLRVGLQFAAVLILVAAFWVKGQAGG
jgi:hypothetical protein